jgi:hypothetical protein
MYLCCLAAIAGSNSLTLLPIVSISVQNQSKQSSITIVNVDGKDVTLLARNTSKSGYCWDKNSPKALSSIKIHQLSLHGGDITIILPKYLSDLDIWPYKNFVYTMFDGFLYDGRRLTANIYAPMHPKEGSDTYWILVKLTGTANTTEVSSNIEQKSALLHLL